MDRVIARTQSISTQHMMSLRERPVYSRKLVSPEGMLPAPFASAAAATTTLAATATTTAAAAASKTASAPSAFSLGAGFIHADLAALELLAVHRSDGRLRLRVIGHLHEAEAAGLAGKLVGDYSGRINLAVGAEKLPEVFVLAVKRKIAYVNVHLRTP